MYFYVQTPSAVFPLMEVKLSLQQRTCKSFKERAAQSSTPTVADSKCTSEYTSEYTLTKTRQKTWQKNWKYLKAVPGFFDLSTHRRRHWNKSRSAWQWIHSFSAQVRQGQQWKFKCSLSSVCSVILSRSLSIYLMFAIVQCWFAASFWSTTSPRNVRPETWTETWQNTASPACRDTCRDTCRDCCNGNSTVQSCPTWNGSTAQLRSTSRLEVQVEVQLNSHVSGKRVPGSPVPSEDFGRAGCGVAVMTKALKNAGLLDSITWSRDSRDTRAVNCTSSATPMWAQHVHSAWEPEERCSATVALMACVENHGRNCLGHRRKVQRLQRQKSFALSTAKSVQSLQSLQSSE